MSADDSQSCAPLPRAELDALNALFDNGQTADVIEKGEALLACYSRSIELNHLLGVANAVSGRFEQAVICFREVLQLKPDSANAHNNLANTLKALGRRDEAIASYHRALDFMPDHPEVHNNLGLTLHELGRKIEAVASYERALQANPDFAMAHHNLGLTLHEIGRREEAVASYERALELLPDHPVVHNNLGITLQELKRRDEAIASYKRALQIAPDYAEAHINLGCILHELGRNKEAIASYERALQIAPDSALTHNNLGLAQQKLGFRDEAIASFERALQIAPDYVEAYTNLGCILHELGRNKEAIASYQRALQIAPDHALAHNNLGCALHDLGCDNEAIASYERALWIAPDYAEAHNNLGSALHELGRHNEAIASYERALRIAPDYALAYSNLGISLQKLGLRDQAIASFESALQLRPDFAPARAHKLHQQAHICDWDTLYSAVSMIPNLGVSGEAVFPFDMLSLEDDPERHKIRAERFSAQKYKQPLLPALPRKSAVPDRLRIGYFSADFHEHAVMYLIARLFELHDRERFIIHAFSLGPDNRDAMRARLMAAFDKFHDVRADRDDEIASLARAEGIDIAVDLMGHTSGMRAGIFMHRAAPIQIGYLGYPGTWGMPFIDYLIADRIVIPESHRRYYSEKILYLPDSFMVGDDTRAISDRASNREEMGLPAQGFVFCCFNNSYKITPAEFDIWMRLLKRVDGSVLWLAQTNPWASSNLQTEARKRGIDPSRVIFTQRIAMADHLARHGLADLFLDTFAYNAHATASDALWAGLPVLTKLGEGFAARVGASLLNALGLPELITTSADDYERLALELATQPDRLEATRSRLAERRRTAPLFGSERFARRIEHGYDLVWQRYLAGLEPDNIDVPVRLGDSCAF